MTIDQQIHDAYTRSRNYPELVQMLIAAGVQSYTVDVSTDTKLYRMADHSTILHGELKIPRTIAEHFDAARVKQCLAATQSMQMSYAQFMPAIADAGVRFYDAVLAGPHKRVNYIGNGGHYEENIPVN